MRMYGLTIVIIKACVHTNLVYQAQNCSTSTRRAKIVAVHCVGEGSNQSMKNV